MTQIMNFKKEEVCGMSKEEAFAKLPFSIQRDVTQSYKNWKKKQTGNITDTNVKQFMLDFLAENSKNIPGVGFSITLQAAVPNKRIRPYKIINKKNESGAKKYQTVITIIDKATGTIVAETKGTKAVARKIIDDLYTKKGATSNYICKYTRQVIEGEPIAFETEYTPSTKACVGKYLVFGIENA